MSKAAKHFPGRQNQRYQTLDDLIDLIHRKGYQIGTTQETPFQIVACSLETENGQPVATATIHKMTGTLVSTGL